MRDSIYRGTPLGIEDLVEKVMMKKKKDSFSESLRQSKCGSSVH